MTLYEKGMLLHCTSGLRIGQHLQPACQGLFMLALSQSVWHEEDRRAL